MKATKQVNKDKQPSKRTIRILTGEYGAKMLNEAIIDQFNREKLKNAKEQNTI